MKNKSLVGSVIVLASIILLSALQICGSLDNVATATMGFLAPSEPTLITIALHALSVVLLVCGAVLIALDLFSKK